MPGSVFVAMIVTSDLVGLLLSLESPSVAKRRLQPSRDRVAHWHLARAKTGWYRKIIRRKGWGENDGVNRAHISPVSVICTRSGIRPGLSHRNGPVIPGPFWGVEWVDSRP